MIFLQNEKRLKDYRREINRKRLIILTVFALIILLSMYSITSGSIELTVGEVVKTILGQGTVQSKLIVFSMRLPRIVTAIIIGASLAVCGVVMQCVLNNPMASSSTLGVSQGAAFGAAVGIILFGGGVLNRDAHAVAVEVNNPYIVTTCAFVFGSLCSGVILLLSQFKRNLGPSALVLAGVALSSLFSGGSTLLQYFADDTTLAAVVFWTFGNLGATNWTEIAILAVAFAAVMIYFMFNRWNYNALCSGVGTAKSLGVNTRSVMLTSMIVCSLTSAVGVAFVGVISFVGLVAPHIMRRLVGEDYRYLIPGSAVAGAFLLLLADTFGRLILQPVILPIGAITSFLGAPMYIMIIMKGGKKRD